MEQDIHLFCNFCLHCQLTLGGTRIPRPMGYAMHATSPNEILHFDFSAMSDSDSGYSYILILLDDFSSFAMLIPCVSTTAEEAAECLMKWFSLFGVVLYWSSDEGPHFKCQLMDQLKKKLYAQHNFKLLPSERDCGASMQGSSTSQSSFDFRFSPSTKTVALDSSYHAKCIESFSSTIHAPITAYTSMTPSTPLTLIIAPKEAEVKSVEFIRAQKIISIQSLIHFLDAIHRKFNDARTRRRDASVKAHNQKTNVRPVNFEIGEYVLVALSLALKEGQNY